MTLPCRKRRFSSRSNGVYTVHSITPAGGHLMACRQPLRSGFALPGPIHPRKSIGSIGQQHPRTSVFDQNTPVQYRNLGLDNSPNTKLFQSILIIRVLAQRIRAERDCVAEEERILGQATESLPSQRSQINRDVSESYKVVSTIQKSWLNLQAARIIAVPFFQRCPSRPKTRLKTSCSSTLSILLKASLNMAIGFFE